MSKVTFIYRGYDIVRDSNQNGTFYTVQLGSAWQFDADSEEAAMKEIDKRKKEQRNDQI